MPLLPKEPTDLALAPVAVQIDRNLAPIRDISPEEIRYSVALQLNAVTPETDTGRAEQIHDIAVRDVEMHNWHADVSADHARLKLAGGSVSLELGLSDSIRRYIEG
jgi:hypothetical protein